MSAGLVPLSSGWCPQCGYDLRGAARNYNHVQCSECGQSLALHDVLAAPPPHWLVAKVMDAVDAFARVLAMLAVSVVVFAALAFILSLGLPYSSTRSQAMTLRKLTYLTQLHRSMLAYATEHGGVYPPHVATLIPTEFVLPDLFDDPSQDSAAEFVVSSFDFASDFDGSEAAIARAISAVDTMDCSSASYQFGEYWFTRLPAPTHDRRIIVCWSALDGEGRRAVAYDDNHVENVDQPGWRNACKQDAAARRELGLPAICRPR